jgi:hypothetical protein
VLSGEKQRIERSYDFIQVVGWFAARCDLILLLFDPYKLDVSDEFKAVSGPGWVGGGGGSWRGLGLGVRWLLRSRRALAQPQPHAYP